jgi:hypothetical protein
MKGHIWRNCEHTLPSLHLNIIAALQPENIPLTLVQKWFRKMSRSTTATAESAPMLRRNAGRRGFHIGA